MVHMLCEVANHKILLPTVWDVVETERDANCEQF